MGTLMLWVLLGIIILLLRLCPLPAPPYTAQLYELQRQSHTILKIFKISKHINTSNLLANGAREKVPAIEPHAMSLNPGTHMVKGEN